jgi:phytoene dehydrogenase-like protein
MKTYDAIVIGAGHNGLTTAAYLAKSGLDVLCLEQNDYIGGATVSRNLHEDWIYSNCSYVCSLLRPEIYRDLELARHGLQVTPYGGSTMFMENGDYYGDFHDPEVHYRELARFSRQDADAYERFSADTMRQCRFIREFLLRTPPDPTSFRPRDLKELAFLGAKFFEMGEQHMYDTIRFWTMSIADFLDEYFETDVVKAALATGGIQGTALGIHSPGTSYVLLHHAMGEVDGNIGAWGFARGGMGAVANAISGSFQSYGGELRTNAGVEQILVRNGKVTGVALGSGEEIKANIVVSAMDVKRTFLKCMDRKDLDGEFYERVENFKIRGSSGKLNIALGGRPTFPALPRDSSLLEGDLHFIDSMERLERAYDDWKEGTWSKDPYVNTVIPTVNDPTMAPPGKHFMSCFIQYCPAKIEGRDWTDEERQQFGQTVIDQIAEYSPDFKSLIEHVEIRTPAVIEEEIGITEGNIFHGELTMDQLMFNRPIPGYAQYRGPLGGLYMCGSSTHPGGGVMSAPGCNAAREILLDLKRPDITPVSFGED